MSASSWITSSASMSAAHLRNADANSCRVMEMGLPRRRSTWLRRASKVGKSSAVRRTVYRNHRSWTSRQRRRSFQAESLLESAVEQAQHHAALEDRFVAESIWNQVRSLSLRATWTSATMTGTSTSGPMVAAKAAPEVSPNDPIATAMASSKLFEAPVKACVTVRP